MPNDSNNISVCLCVYMCTVALEESQDFLCFNHFKAGFNREDNTTGSF